MDIYEGTQCWAHLLKGLVLLAEDVGARRRSRDSPGVAKNDNHIYLSIYLSTYLSIYLSIYIHIYIYIHINTYI